MEHYECKVRVLRADEGGEAEVRGFNRLTIWQRMTGQDAITYEADFRQAEALMKGLGVEECKPVASPHVTDDGEIDGGGAQQRCPRFIRFVAHH